jgi:hypothetical protein
MDFFTSDIGTSIAWFCTVIGFLYGFIGKKKNEKLKITVLELKQHNESLEINVNDLSAKVADFSRNEVNQTGEKNVYTKNNSGGLKIEM